jgi:hypothetical protein
MTELSHVAYGVLFPVITELAFEDSVRSFLDNGGEALLFSETSEEYTSGQMSPERLAAESAEAWQRVTTAAPARAGALIIALDADADVSAVHRLQGLTPPSAKSCATARHAFFMMDDGGQVMLGAISGIPAAAVASMPKGMLAGLMRCEGESWEALLLRLNEAVMQPVVENRVISDLHL